MLHLVHYEKRYASSVGVIMCGVSDSASSAAQPASVDSAPVSLCMLCLCACGQHSAKFRVMSEGQVKSSEVEEMSALGGCLDR